LFSRARASNTQLLAIGYFSRNIQRTRAIEFSRTSSTRAPYHRQPASDEHNHCIEPTPRVMSYLKSSAASPGRRSRETAAVPRSAFLGAVGAAAQARFSSAPLAQMRHSP
jgi:hypothetical protein